jgi:hypothetical protein
MSVDLDRCQPLFGNEQAAYPPRAFCVHCDAPINADGEHTPPTSTHDAAEAVMRLMTFFYEHPQAALAVAGRHLGHPLPAIARQFKKLTGKAISRQGVRAACLTAQRHFPELATVLFARKHATDDLRAQAKPASATVTCAQCGAVEKRRGPMQRYCVQCAAKREGRKTPRKRGVFYPSDT